MLVFLIGHGKWVPNDSYATIPSGTTFTFYTQNAKLLAQAQAMKIVGGTANFEPDAVYTKFQTVPNMTLMPYGDADIAKFRCAITNRVGRPATMWCTKPGQDIRLSEIFKLSELIGHELAWIACRQLMLQEIKGYKGRSIGVNARENEDSYFFRYGLEPGHRHPIAPGSRTSQDVLKNADASSL